MDAKTKHLELLQIIIQRIANNSFLLKGWTVTLIVAIFTLASKDAIQIYFILAYIPVFAFWFLDAYYLQLERKYITLYDIVRQKKIVDFDLSISELTYKKIKKKTLKYINCLFSKSEWLFYIPIAVLLTIIFKKQITSILALLKL